MLQLVLKPKREKRRPLSVDVYRRNFGVRQSPRLKMKRRALTFVEQISPEEFEEEKGEYTQHMIKLLEKSPEYKKMKKQKGKRQENWNW